MRLTAADPQALIAAGITGVVILLCTIALVGGARSERERMTYASSQLEEHEQVMENVKITRTVPDLRVNYMIETVRLTQYPDRGLSELEAPVLTEVNPDGKVRIITARKGVFVESGNTLELEGDVEIVERQTPESSETTTAHSSKLTIKF